MQNFTECVNGTLQPGDLVISTPDDDYACLVGTVLEINKLGTPEHDTENDTDDVHVDFSNAEYFDQRIEEIRDMLSDLYDAGKYSYKNEKDYTDCPPDDAIMAPENLIRITGIEAEKLDELLESYENAAVFCNSIQRVRELTGRLTENLNNYHDSLLNLDKEAIIGNAGMIAAVTDTHYYLTENYEFADAEVDYLLLFENPLAIVAEKWCDRTALMDDFSFALDEVFSKREALDSSHRLYEKPIPPMPLESFKSKKQMARYEAERLVSELKSIRTPNHPNKVEYMTKVSPDFIRQFDGDWLEPLTALSGVIRPFIPAFGHFGQGEDVYMAISAKERDIIEVVKPTFVEKLRDGEESAADARKSGLEQKTEDFVADKKPSILGQLQAARVAPAPEKQPKPPGTTKGEQR